MKHFRYLQWVLIILAALAILHSCRKGEMKVETTDVSKVMATIATAQAYILDLGEGVEQHGHCWDTTANPTINSNKTENGSASRPGTFASNLTDLKQATTYHIRAYLQTGNEVVYGRDLTFTTLNGKVIMITQGITNITVNSASSGGNIYQVNGDTVISKGVCWDTLENVNLEIKAGFTADGPGLGEFTSELTGLIPDQTYYVKAYTITSADTSYAPGWKFKTRNGHISLKTTESSSVTNTSASTGGNITYDGGAPVTARGVCYATTANPTILDNITTDGSGTGAFTSTLSGLSINTIYYVKAYATNIITTVYGDQQSFLTKGLPELTTASVQTDIKTNYAVCGGTVTTDWGNPVTERGVCWSTNQNPTIADSRTIDGSGLGSFTSNLSGIIPGVTYYIRAYASNNAGTGYGEQKTSTITAIVEFFNTSTGRTWMDRNLGANSPGEIGDLYQWGRATDGHEKRNSGTASVLSNSDTPEHGLFIIGNNDWRNPQNDNLWQGVNGINNPCPFGYRIPTETEWLNELSSWSNTLGWGSVIHVPWGGYRGYDDGKIEGVTGVSVSGSYWSSTVSGSSIRIFFIYHLGSGMSSGSRAGGLSVRCIKDLNGYPMVKTANISSRPNNTATCGGRVIEDGGNSVTERGVCWSTNPDPTTSDSRTIEGGGTGSFTSSLSGLIPTGTYYVRAYATNSTGTSYGQQVTITPFTEIVDVTNPVTGRTWMDRNLGASRAATSSNDTEAYGFLYQWGRGNDGHQVRTSGTTRALSSSDTVGHGLYIMPQANPFNWRRPVNYNLWQGVNGTNNPCPGGYRLPTEAEWIAEYNSWSSKNISGAFSSLLKIPMSANRNNVASSSGAYWSSTAWSAMIIREKDAIINQTPLAGGLSVRCIKD